MEGRNARRRHCPGARRTTGFLLDYHRDVIDRRAVSTVRHAVKLQSCFVGDGRELPGLGFPAHVLTPLAFRVEFKSRTRAGGAYSELPHLRAVEWLFNAGQAERHQICLPFPRLESLSNASANSAVQINTPLAVRGLPVRAY